MITASHKPPLRRIAFAVLCGVCLILTFCFSDIAIEHMQSGLILCAKTIIPSLFPFMVVSELIIYSKVGDFLGKIFKPITKTLFGISEISSCAVILGALCGFPIGAKTAISLFDKGYIGKKEAERLIAFCNNPSSAFLLNVVGLTLYANKRIGIIFYVITIVNSCIVGMAWHLMYGKCVAKIYKADTSSEIKIMTAFTNAVSSATGSILIVCSYVVFFSSIMGCLGHCLDILQFPAGASALLYGFIELSGGVNASSSMGYNVIGIGITAFIIGWSGFSVHFQIISICQKHNINFKGYFISKLIHGILNAFSAIIIYALFPSTFKPSGDVASIPSLSQIPSTWQNIALLLFAVSVCIYFYNIRHKSTVHIIY